MPVKKVGAVLVAELFHGPTLAFKDFGQQVLCRMLDYFAVKRNRDITLVCPPCLPILAQRSATTLSTCTPAHMQPARLVSRWCPRPEILGPRQSAPLQDRSDFASCARTPKGRSPDCKSDK